MKTTSKEFMLPILSLSGVPGDGAIMGRIDGQKKQIAVCEYAEFREQIVHACNSHAALVAALEYALDAVPNAAKGEHVAQIVWHSIEEQLRAALAQAKS